MLSRDEMNAIRFPYCFCFALNGYISVPRRLDTHNSWQSLVIVKKNDLQEFTIAVTSSLAEKLHKHIELNAPEVLGVLETRLSRLLRPYWLNRTE